MIDRHVSGRERSGSGPLWCNGRTRLSILSWCVSSRLECIVLHYLVCIIHSQQHTRVHSRIRVSRTASNNSLLLLASMHDHLSISVFSMALAAATKASFSDWVSAPVEICMPCFVTAASSVSVSLVCCCTPLPAAIATSPSSFPAAVSS